MEDPRKKPALYEELAERGLSHPKRTLCTLCGVVDAIEIRPNDPLAKPAGPWGVCPKGATFLEVNGLGRTDRVTHCMMKVDGKWKQSTWRDTMDLIADKLLSIRDEFGPDSIGFYGVGQMTLESIWASQKLFHGWLRSNVIAANSEQCVASSAGGHELIFGNEGSFGAYEDFLHAEAIFLYGANPALNHPTLFAQGIAQNRKAEKFIFDPRKSETVKRLLKASPKNRHVAYQPGADVVFNYAIAHAILRDQKEDRAYLEFHVDPKSFEDFCNKVKQEQYSPREVAKRIALYDVKELEDNIEYIASLWTSKKIASMSSVGINQMTGSYGIASILALHVLTGQIGEPGRGHVRVSGQSNAPSELAMGLSSFMLPFRIRLSDAEGRAAMEKFWKLPAGWIRDKVGKNLLKYADEDGPRFILACGTDFTRNIPNIDKWRAKLKERFLVVADTYVPEEVYEFADVILPVRSHAETTGVYINGERRVMLMEQVLEPAYEVKSDLTIIVDLANRLGRNLQRAGLPGVGVGQKTQTYEFGKNLEGIEDTPSSYLPTKIMNAISAPKAMLGKLFGSRSVEKGREMADKGGGLLGRMLSKVSPVAFRHNRDLVEVDFGAGFAYKREDWGEVNPEEVFKEICAASSGYYNEFIDGDGKPITYQRLRAENGVQWGGERRYYKGQLFPRIRRDKVARANLVLAPQEIEGLYQGGHAFRLLTGRGTGLEKDYKVYLSLFNSGLKAKAAGIPEETIILMHPDDLRKLQTKDGEELLIKSRIGELKLTVRESTDVAPGVPFAPFQPALKYQPLNRLIPDDQFCPITKQPRLKYLPVEIQPTRKIFLAPKPEEPILKDTAALAAE
jgi:anaerobic selenocysteine-containing dehydrogenase